MMKLWVRKCSSFEEEAEADRDFWRSMTPDERVAVVEEMRLASLEGEDEDVRRLRRVVRIVELQNKRATGRPQDMMDLSWLEALSTEGE